MDLEGKLQTYKNQRPLYNTSTGLELTLRHPDSCMSYYKGCVQIGIIIGHLHDDVILLLRPELLRVLLSCAN